MEHINGCWRMIVIFIMHLQYYHVLFIHNKRHINKFNIAHKGNFNRLAY